MGHELSLTIREQRRERIVRISTEVFFEEGYAAATMATIARRIGGSKATLYAYFKSKEDLFEEIIRKQCDVFSAALDQTRAMPSLRDKMLHLGMSLMTALVSDAGVKTLQLTIEGCRHNPEIPQRFNEVGVKFAVEKLEAFMGEARDRGELEAPDLHHAANVFVSLMRGDLHFQRLLNLIPEPSSAEVQLEVERAVAVFLTAFRKG